MVARIWRVATSASDPERTSKQVASSPDEANGEIRERRTSTRPLIVAM